MFRGFWALHGGKVEDGETVEEAVVREVREETGNISNFFIKGFEDV